MTVLGTELYFIADDGVHGRELWKSDGTANGTQLVKDIDGTPASSFIGLDEIVVANNLLFFAADDGIVGEELWKSNGTNLGTTLVADIEIGPFSSAIQHLTSTGSEVYFQADKNVLGTELWKADDTGAQVVKDIHPTGDSVPENITVVGEKIFLRLFTMKLVGNYG